MAKVVVKIPAGDDKRFKSWGKVITSVDRSKDSEDAFVGKSVKRGRKVELEVGDIVMLYDEVGTNRENKPGVPVHKVIDVTVHTVQENGTLSWTVAQAGGSEWYLELRDIAVALMA